MNLLQAIKNRNVQDIVKYMKEHGLSLKDGKIIHHDKKYIEGQQEYWDKRQLVQKINLNS
jgi:nucleoside diphosphate kinase